MSTLEELDRSLPTEAPERLRLLTALANALTDRFEAAHVTTDLTRAIDLYEQARSVAATSQQRASRSNEP